MRVRFALSLLIGFFGSPLTAAEFPTFETAEMIKSQIDKSMPGVQKRDTEVLQKLLLDFAPAETVAEMMPKYDPLFKAEMLPSEAGWSYVRAKTVGSIYRQFVYVCRYDRAFIVWRFAAVEKEGRWSLLNVAVGTTADDLLEDKPAGDEQCIPFCEKIANMLAGVTRTWPKRSCSGGWRMRSRSNRSRRRPGGNWRPWQSSPAARP